MRPPVRPLLVLLLACAPLATHPARAEDPVTLPVRAELDRPSIDRDDGTPPSLEELAAQGYIDFEECVRLAVEEYGYTPAAAEARCARIFAAIAAAVAEHEKVFGVVGAVVVVTVATTVAAFTFGAAGPAPLALAVDVRDVLAQAEPVADFVGAELADLRATPTPPAASLRPPSATTRPARRQSVAVAPTATSTPIAPVIPERSIRTVR